MLTSTAIPRAREARIPTPVAADEALLVKLSARPDFTTVAAMPRGAARKAAAFAAITETAQRSQEPLLALAQRLKNEGAVAGWETLVSPNMLVVTPVLGKSTVVLNAFKAAQGVKAVYSNENGYRYSDQGVPLQPPKGVPASGWDVLDQPVQEVAAAAVARPYGIDLVGAPAAWAVGATGAGLVFGSVDTGADVTHPALAEAYRGRNADGTLTHDYNWFDPSKRTTAPRDPQGHGSHTVGTAVGKDVGVAPGAKFISALALEGNIDSTLRALQWMLAPTRTDGTAPDPTKAPDVVGMSWYAGSPSDDLFLENVQDLRAAGIVPVKSAGNQGPRAGTITSPGQFGEVLAAAAVDKTGKVANFSSRGPAPWPKGATTPKPDFALPGVDIVSSIPGGKYGTMSGTSMAQPHLSGVILDVLSKYPQLTDAQLTQVLRAGATDKGAVGFDAEYGAGLVNLPATLAAAEKLLAGGARAAA